MLWKPNSYRCSWMRSGYSKVISPSNRRMQLRRRGTLDKEVVDMSARKATRYARLTVPMAGGSPAADAQVR